MDTMEDFPLKQRRHYGEHPAQQGELTAGCTATVEEDLGFGHLNRNGPRPGVYTYQEQKNILATGEAHTQTLQQKASSDSSLWQSSYQAQCSGNGIDNTKRRGKKQVQPPQHMRNTNVIGGGATAFSAFGGGATYQPGPARSNESVDIHSGRALSQVPFLPGYGGHVPSTNANLNTAAAAVQKPRMTKDLLVENHRIAMTGCTKMGR